MARGDGKAKKGMTRGGPKVKRMLLGGSVDGPAPSNASSMRSGYSGGTTGGNNFGAGGAGGLGGSSREGGFAGAGVGRLESPMQRSSIQPGAGNVSGGRGGYSDSDAYNSLFASVPGKIHPISVGHYPNLNLPQTGLGPRQVVPNTAATGDMLSTPSNPIRSPASVTGVSATPTSDYRAPAAVRPAAPSATPAGDYRAPAGTIGSSGPSAQTLNDAFQRKAAQFFAEGSPTGFRGTPGSQYFGGQVPAPPREPVGGSYNSAMRTGRPAGSGAPEVTGPAFPQGLADRGPSRLTNLTETPTKITDRYPGATGPTQGPQWATYGNKQPAQPPTPQPRPDVSRPSFGPGEPPSDRGSARGEGGSNRRKPVEHRERMASGGMVNRGDGKARVKTKGKMI